MKRNSRKVLWAGVTAVMAASVLSACGGSSGPPTLTWFINPDSGGQATLAKECTTAANGKYKINIQTLPNDASAQRQQLVTRLAAKDSSISLMSLDPVFVSEFAEAGFLADVPARYKDEFTQNIVTPAIDASTWKGKLVAAPFWANTQLLWYRKSLAAKVPGLSEKLKNGTETWDDVINAAKTQNRAVGVQAKLYEGYTVWINALIEGAGGKIIESKNGTVAKNLKLGLDTTAGKEAADVIRKLAADKVGGPALSSADEAAALGLFEAPATSMFMAIWPYVWGAMKADKVSFRGNDAGTTGDVGWTYYPRTVADKASKPPFGGIELGVSKFADNQPMVWDAINCIRTADHQAEYFLGSSNPPANTTSFDNADVRKAYPMADLIKNSLQRAAPRPQTQYYGDLSSALQQSFSPPSSVTSSTPKQAQTFILQVLKGEKLL